MLYEAAAGTFHLPLMCSYMGAGDECNEYILRVLQAVFNILSNTSVWPRLNTRKAKVAQYKHGLSAVFHLLIM